MKAQKDKKRKKLNKKRIQRVNSYERMFSACRYRGIGKKYIGVADGKSEIAIAAPCAVNYFDGESRPAERFTGGLVRTLARETMCHAIYAKKAYSEAQITEVISDIENYLQKKKIRVLIDIQITESMGDSVIELWSDLEEKYSFIENAIRYSFEYAYRDMGIKEAVRRCALKKESAAFLSASAEKTGYVYLGINREYCEPLRENAFLQLFDTLSKTMTMLSNLDWNADRIEVYRLWQSMTHKPQDKIELCLPNEKASGFAVNSLLNICSYGRGLEKVRLHEANQKVVDNIGKDIDDRDMSLNKKEYIFLTNRLIELLFEREWIQGKEEKAGLRGAPVVVYESKKEVYPIGIPKANQIDGVFFSTALFESKKEEAALFDYVIFNRYTDSRLHIKFEKTDYADYGRVKDKDGLPARKVMIPRYYKRLLGYLDYPLKMIRSEEYKNILENLTEDEKKSFEECYEAMNGESFYTVKENVREEDKDAVISVQKRLGLYSSVEVLRTPKEVKQKQRLYKKILHKLDRFRIWLLEKTIGKSEYLLKTEWTSETDDRNAIARLSPNMMSLLGVSENDKILVKFGEKQEILRVLANENLTDYQIGIPAPARKRLGMNSVNDIVIVHRDMVHIFWRHSEEQTIAILGTVLAVFQVVSKMWIGAVLCFVCIPLIMYFVLNEERVKVK